MNLKKPNRLHKHGGRAMKDQQRSSLKSNQKVEVFEYEGRIEYVPIQPMKNLRG